MTVCIQRLSSVSLGSTELISLPLTDPCNPTAYRIINHSESNINIIAWLMA